MRFKVETIIIKYHYWSGFANDNYWSVVIHNNYLFLGSSLHSLDRLIGFIDRIAVGVGLFDRILIAIDYYRTLYDHWLTSHGLGDGVIDYSSDGCTDEE